MKRVCNFEGYSISEKKGGGILAEISGSQIIFSTVLQIGRSLVRFQMVSLGFFIDIILPSHYGPGVDSASNRNEYHEYRVIRNYCRGFNKLSYTIHLR